MDFDREFFAPLREMERRSDEFDTRVEAALERWDAMDRMKRSQIIESYLSDNDRVADIAACLSHKPKLGDKWKSLLIEKLAKFEEECAEEWARNEAEKE